MPKSSSLKTIDFGQLSDVAFVYQFHFLPPELGLNQQSNPTGNFISSSMPPKHYIKKLKDVGMVVPKIKETRS